MEDYLRVGCDLAILSMIEGEESIFQIPPEFQISKQALLAHQGILDGLDKLPVCLQLRLLHIKKLGLANPRTLAEQIDFSNQIRSNGNELFKKKKFKLALEEYKTSLPHLIYPLSESADPLLVEQHREAKKMLFLNLCACKIELKNFKEAIREANSVLEIDPKNLKALYRRAKANRMLGNLNQAQRDIRLALEASESNNSSSEKGKPPDPLIEAELRSIQLSLSKQQLSSQNAEKQFCRNIFHSLEAEVTQGLYENEEPGSDEEHDPEVAQEILDRKGREQWVDSMGNIIFVEKGKPSSLL